MDLTKLRYWQWMAVSIVVGSAAVWTHKWSVGGMSGAAVPTDLSAEQRRFETALLTTIQGHAMSRNIRVSPRRVVGEDGGDRAVHVVEAEYRTGEPEEHSNQRQYIWRESRFVLPVPYRTQIDLSEKDRAVATEFTKRLRAGRDATVIDLLDAARVVRKAGYSYTWWDAYPWRIFGGGSVLLLGIIAPLVLHPVTFGRLTRPVEKRIALTHWQVTQTPEPTAAPALHAAPPMECEAAGDPETEFGMKADDYYPTERHIGKT